MATGTPGRTPSPEDILEAGHPGRPSTQLSAGGEALCRFKVRWDPYKYKRLAGLGNPKVSKAHRPWQLRPGVPAVQLAGASPGTTLRTGRAGQKWGLCRGWGWGGPSRSCTQRGPHVPACTLPVAAGLWGPDTLERVRKDCGWAGWVVARTGDCGHSELVTQGDGSRSARPQLGLKGVRTDGIQRCPQKGFLSIPPAYRQTSAPFSSAPGAGALAALHPCGDSQAMGRESTHRPATLPFVFIKTGFEIQILPHGHQGWPSCKQPPDFLL